MRDMAMRTQFTIKGVLVLTTLIAIESGLFVSMFGSEAPELAVAWLLFGAIAGPCVVFAFKRRFTIEGVLLGIILGIVFQALLLLACFPQKHPAAIVLSKLGVSPQSRPQAAP